MCGLADIKTTNKDCVLLTLYWFKNSFSIFSSDHHPSHKQNTLQNLISKRKRLKYSSFCSSSIFRKLGVNQDRSWLKHRPPFGSVPNRNTPSVENISKFQILYSEQRKIIWIQWRLLCLYKDISFVILHSIAVI